ncbi:MAG: carboxymuconolactone decarboxylase family protein [Deltaproteobacteria bacterium]|nr:carboxymuconolactone decarboxylase family protein [Deltaproteobacteria bacterium]
MPGKKPPKAYTRFVTRHPKLGDAWLLAREAELQGPLDEATKRLVKLAVAIGAMREGAVHSATRKALAAGASPQALDQVVALAASTIGLPSAVAVDGWVHDVVDGDEPKGE